MFFYSVILYLLNFFEMSINVTPALDLNAKRKIEANCKYQ